MSPLTSILIKKPGHKDKRRKGRWCSICKYVSFPQSMLAISSHLNDHRDDPHIKKKKGALAGFFFGSSSSNRRHLGSRHYEKYAALCAAAGFTIPDSALPRRILKAREQEKERQAAKKAKAVVAHQSTLDAIAQKVPRPTQFSREGIARAVMIHIVVGDQVSTPSTDAIIYLLTDCCATRRPLHSCATSPSRIV